MWHILHEYKRPKLNIDRHFRYHFNYNEVIRLTANKVRFTTKRL